MGSPLVGSGVRIPSPADFYKKVVKRDATFALLSAAITLLRG